MTIKEMEELAGMPRANIRFYEAEGLLSPTRNVNGYRDYSGEDLEVLKKIKLLRSLHISLDEIKSLHSGEQELSVALEQHIRQLSSRQDNLNKAQDVCKTMYQDGVCYQNLNAEKYLNHLNSNIGMRRVEPEREKFSWEVYWDAGEAEEDTLPRVQAPWRRFFARTLDEALYSVIWSCFLMLALDVNLTNRSSAANFLDIGVTLLLTLILEPLQLALFGTTLGKWILGLHIRHNDDRKLSISEASERTLQVLFSGLGLHIPIFTLFRLWKSYKACNDGETLAWEYDSRIILKDEKSFRAWIYIAVRVLFVGLVLFANLLAQIPPHQGDLAVAQFSQNYRILADYYGMQSGYTLGNDGKWSENAPDGSVVIYLSEQQAPPDFVFETDENGVIRKISFTVEAHISAETDEDKRPWMSNFQTQMQLASLSFVGARDEFPHFSSARRHMLDTISSHAFEDYSFTEAGVTVSCDVESRGYHDSASSFFLIPNKEGECYFYLEFSMTKSEG